MENRIVILSGPAGAGKTTAARALEDLGFFVVDNLPPQLIHTMIELSNESGGKLRQLAFVVDAREERFLKTFSEQYKELQVKYPNIFILFLDCDEKTLIKRYKETRRRHPLEQGDGISASIQREKILLNDIQHNANQTIDTRHLTVHQLRDKVTRSFSDSNTEKRLITLMSFGFKHGLPPELDVCFDVRFIPNPYFVEDLRPLTGLDSRIQDYVLKQDSAQTFLGHLYPFADFLLPSFLAEGKSYMTFAIGCTGGKHRSVTLVEEFAKRLKSQSIPIQVIHRDVEKK